MSKGNHETVNLKKRRITQFINKTNSRGGQDEVDPAKWGGGQTLYCPAPDKVNHYQRVGDLV